MVEGRPILVVDDDPDVRDIVAQYLEDAGYPVETAIDGTQALRAVERGRPSLLLTDLHMPNLDGGALALLLHERGYDPPIVIMTGTTRTPEQVRDAVGADACISKPLDPDALLAMVERLRVP